VKPFSPTPCTDDDEDCEEGSGDGDDDDDDDEEDNSVKRPPPHSIGKGGEPKTPAITYQWSGMKTPAPTPFYARPAPTPFEDKSIMFTSRPIPPDPSVVTEPPKPRVTIPPRPTGPRVIVDVPKPERPTHFREKEEVITRRTTTPVPIPSHRYHQHNPYVPPSSSNPFSNKSSADRTALVIGIIAFIFLVIVIIASAVVFVKVKFRPQVPKSIDNRKNYQFHSVSGTPTLLLPNSAAASASVAHLNVTGGPPIISEFKQPQVPILPKKDLKEWYV